MNILQYDRKIPWYIALFILTIITLAMFADVVFFPDDLILSDNTSDIVKQFFYWRDFGFSQLKHGIWHCGTPTYFQEHHSWGDSNQHFFIRQIFYI